LHHHVTGGVLGPLTIHRDDGGTFEDHVATSRIRSAAKRTASRIFSYPVQRHRLPARASRISGSVGCPLRPSRSCAATTRPGVQKPHCTAPASRKACWTGCRSSPSASPSTVRPSRPCGCPAPTRREHTAPLSRYPEHERHPPCPA